MQQLSPALPDGLQPPDPLVQLRLDDGHVIQGLRPHLFQQRKGEVGHGTAGEVPSLDDSARDDGGLTSVATRTKVLAQILAVAIPLHES